eukprot:4018508-Amphidinium_carterae.1
MVRMFACSFGDMGRPCMWVSVMSCTKTCSKIVGEIILAGQNWKLNKCHNPRVKTLPLQSNLGSNGSGTHACT